MAVVGWIALGIGVIASVAALLGSRRPSRREGGRSDSEMSGRYGRW